jgi:hypothetical protein
MEARENKARETLNSKQADRPLSLQKALQRAYCVIYNTKEAQKP